MSNKQKGIDDMNNTILTIGEIKRLIKPIAVKYKVKEIYLFGSYARGDANESSDIDFLVFGGENFRLTKQIHSEIPWLMISGRVLEKQRLLRLQQKKLIMRTFY